MVDFRGGGIIDAEQRALELEIDSLNRRLENLELKLRSTLFMVDEDYREIQGMRRNIDDLYVKVF